MGVGKHAMPKILFVYPASLFQTQKCCVLSFDRAGDIFRHTGVETADESFPSILRGKTNRDMFVYESQNIIHEKIDDDILCHDYYIYLSSLCSMRDC